MKISNYKIITIAILFFIFGYFFPNIKYNHLVPRGVEKEDFTLFWDVWETLEERYPFEEPLESDKRYEAIKGLVRSYDDEYSMFFPPETSQQFHDTVNGEFGGAGMEITSREGYLIVIAPLKDSPAERAGFLPGDVITHIEDENVYGKSLDELIALIRGEVGTKVTMTIVRVDEAEPIDLILTRDIIKIPILDTEIVDGAFVLSLYNFNQNSEDDFRIAMEEFKNSDTDYLLLDLRNNPGGYLFSAVGMTSYFLDQGRIIVKEDFGDSGKKQRIHRSKGLDVLSDKNYQLGVLINRGSASAAEIVAGALQFHKGGIIIGEQSYGKGSVQELIELGQDTSLKVTVAKWLMPDDEDISKQGITPDIFIDDIHNRANEDVISQAIKILKTTP